MFRINRKIEYALISLKYMRSKPQGELTPAREIVEKFGTPFDVTSRVLQSMAHAKIVKSEQGSTGGYQIIRDLNRVSYKELSDCILGSMALAKCLSGKDCDLISKCGVLSPLQHLNDRMTEFLSELSLLDILEPKGQKQNLDGYEERANLSSIAVTEGLI